ncbi:YCII-related protein [Cellulomonas flavigena DSM 20109]|uniref:YCII-related protein n=1 Tax=Cellulomonas flavigena (strain ATCC 482 / DSM 20109 / BCRC 11376 / JCM 18109 / NBRC 3775 / NCIMB 8073 / NRS 134) TaxID=446466 RepID=D5UJT7_CELFN|nr:YciI family protein [Cellulomonas flavigena]ADG75725.1 YCII-related protein [Cellulomonas flavigena DSM 20109]
MLITRATDEAVAASAEMGLEEIIAAMGRYNESMMQAGVLVAGEGLADASQGAVVEFTGEEPVVSDGPYGETKELFNGFWILDVASQDDAVAWARRAPLGAGTKLEVRRVTGPEDFPQDNEWIQKEQGWREQLGTV